MNLSVYKYERMDCIKKNATIYKSLIYIIYYYYSFFMKGTYKMSLDIYQSLLPRLVL